MTSLRSAGPWQLFAALCYLLFRPAPQVALALTYGSFELLVLRPVHAQGRAAAVRGTAALQLRQQGTAGHGQRGERRYRQFGSLNVMIELHDGSRLPDIFGLLRPARRIAISIDKPAPFIRALNHAAGSLHGI